MDENTTDAPLVEQHTVITVELGGPLSAMRDIMKSANGGKNDPFLNFLAYLHGTTQNLGIHIRSVYMEDLDVDSD